MLVTDIGDTYVGDKIEMLITEEKSPKILKLSPLQSHHHTGTTGPVVQPIKNNKLGSQLQASSYEPT